MMGLEYGLAGMTFGWYLMWMGITILPVFIFTLFCEDGGDYPFKFASFLEDVETKDDVFYRLLISAILSVLWFIVLPMSIGILIVMLITEGLYKFLMTLKKCSISISKKEE